MDYKFIKVETNDYITIITLNRPEVLNAINPETSTELHQAWNAFNNSDDQKIAIITGTGNRAFSAGADLKAAAERRARGEPAGDGMSYAGAGLLKGTHIYKPMIAAVNGYAIGGGLELTLACDIRLASENASFGLSEVRWSLIASGGGLSYIMRNIPRAIAMRMILTGEHIDAQEAYRIGLINEIVPQNKLLPRAIEIARVIGQNGPLAVSTSKETAIRGMDLPLDKSFILEDQLATRVSKTNDNKEGPTAFTQKRRPKYLGE